MKREENKQALLAVRVGVIECLGGDDSGHGMDHIDRVERLTVRFCDEFKGEVDPFVARLIALLHDVDDYKLVGHTNAARLSNATAIMTTAGIGGVTQKRVLSAIKTIGYSKSLRGIRPTTVEGKIVSDADMCDAIGANGVMRSLLYAVSPKGNGRIFDPSVWPDVAIGADTYNADGNTHDTDGFINHFFEKMLKLKDMMLTEPGIKEAAVRDAFMIEFLRHYFREQNVEEWSVFLEKHLEDR